MHIYFAVNGSMNHHRYTEQQRRHADILGRFERDMELLAAIEIAPQARTAELARLSDLVQEQRMRDWAAQCSGTHRNISEKVRALYHLCNPTWQLGKVSIGDIALVAALRTIWHCMKTLLITPMLHQQSLLVSEHFGTDSSWCPPRVQSPCLCAVLQDCTASGELVLAASCYASRAVCVHSVSRGGSA